jgi:hypothetical protein
VGEVSKELSKEYRVNPSTWGIDVKNENSSVERIPMVYN